MKTLTAKDVEQFGEECTFLKIVHGHFTTLYEKDAKRLQLLEDSAHAFFHDMQYVLITFLLLQVCKLTDPPEMNKRDNLTVRLILENTDFSADPAKVARLKALSEDMHRFRELIVGARNQRISHIDREAALSNVNLGGFKYGEFETFLENLQAFVNIVHEQYVGGPRDLGSYSDAFEVIDALRKAQFFGALSASPEGRTLCARARAESEYRSA
jgi:hypothetical protein